MPEMTDDVTEKHVPTRTCWAVCQIINEPYLNMSHVRNKLTILIYYYIQYTAIYRYKT